MPDLSSYVNVYNTSLVIIESKGFSVSHDKVIWFARKNGWELMADDPIQLLGLVAIFEHHDPKVKSEYWWRINDPDLTNQLD